MADLGAFGAARREVERATGAAEPDTFNFCGETFTAVGEIPAMLMLQLGAAASGKVDETEGMVALWEAVRCSLTAPQRQVDGETVPEDAAEFGRFYRLAVSNGVELEELIRLAMALFQAGAGRPTVRQPDSPPGPPPTSTSSNGSSSTHPALQGMTRVDEVLVG